MAKRSKVSIGGAVKGLTSTLKSNWLVLVVALFTAAIAAVLIKRDAKDNKVTLMGYITAAGLPFAAAYFLKKKLTNAQASHAALISAGMLFMWDQLETKLLATPGTKQIVTAGYKAAGMLNKDAAARADRLLAAANGKVAANQPLPAAEVGYTPPATSPNPGAQLRVDRAGQVIDAAGKVVGVIDKITDIFQGASGVGRGPIVPRWNDPRWGVGGDRAGREANLAHVGMQ